MVITQTLFQTKGAGDGFRRFRLGIQGDWLRVDRVDDLVALRPFRQRGQPHRHHRAGKGAAHRVSGGVCEMGARPRRRPGVQPLPGRGRSTLPGPARRG